MSDIHVVRTGPRGGSPLVFVHALGLDLTWWGEQIDEFGRDHDVIAFDLPGHGLSARPLDAPGFEQMADVLEGVLAEAGAGPADIVGVSLGGMVAQTFAVRRPERVRSLGLVATLCTFAEPVRAALRERARVARTEGMARIAQLSNQRWFPPHFGVRRPDVLDRATSCLQAHDPDFYAAMWETVSALDLEPKLPAVACPTLVVVGSEDVNAPLAAGAKIAALIAGATLTEMRGVGHFPPVEAPAAFNALLRRFLDGHRAP